MWYTSYGKSFKYKAKIVEKTPEKLTRPPRPAQNPHGTQPPQPPQPELPTLNVEATIPLKYLSNFWRFFDLPLIKCKIKLNLSWRKNYVLIEYRNNITGTTFQINNNKLYVPVVTLSINDNVKFLENVKQGFKRTISCNNYRSEITTPPKINNLDYLIDPIFRIINWLFVLSLKNGNDDPIRHFFGKCYMLLS